MADVNVAAVVDALVRDFPTAVLRPGAALYDVENGRVWNRDNADVRPEAIVTPSNPHELGSIVKLLSETNTPFAIRSGGYMPLKGYNTSPSVLISTSRFSNIELLSDGLVRFGAGLQWGQVYDFLSPHGLVVPGGRSRPVGVGGFLLHGGVSHFYGEVGWACESVVEFEVVLANGDVVTASQSEHEDLYWALKGGGNNFGIVTAFTMRTRALPKMWGGPRIALGDEDTARQVFRAMHDGITGDADPKAHVEVISFFNPHVCQGGEAMFALCLAYAGAEEKPEALKGFWEVPAVADMTRVTTQSDLADDDKTFVGYDKRALFRAFSYRGSPELTLGIYKEFYALAKEHEAFKEDPTAVAALLWLPTGPRMARGTSAVSLSEDAEPYLAATITLRWEKPEVSDKMHSVADVITQQLKNKVKDAGADIRFTYGNIAGVGDVTFAGLPKKTRARLREIAEKYDPQGVFQKQVPGHKLE